MQMKFRVLAGAIVVALAAAVPVLAQDAAPGATPSPAGAKVYFINLKDGQHVKSPLLVQFGLSGMGVAPFGLTGANTANTGHHHLIIDAATPAAGVPIPADATHVHYGRGQTEAMVMLAPGPHTLQLVLADAGHIEHVPPVVSDKITITVDP
jgi:hypothetical protein